MPRPREPRIWTEPPATSRRWNTLSCGAALLRALGTRVRSQALHPPSPALPPLPVGAALTFGLPLSRERKEAGPSMSGVVALEQRTPRCASRCCMKRGRAASDLPHDHEGMYPPMVSYEQAAQVTMGRLLNLPLRCRSDQLRVRQRLPGHAGGGAEGRRPPRPLRPVGRHRSCGGGQQGDPGVNPSRSPSDAGPPTLTTPVHSVASQ